MGDPEIEMIFFHRKSGHREIAGKYIEKQWLTYRYMKNHEIAVGLTYRYMRGHRIVVDLTVVAVANLPLYEKS